jgi:hypothetical protein
VVDHTFRDPEVTDTQHEFTSPDGMGIEMLIRFVGRNQVQCVNGADVIFRSTLLAFGVDWRKENLLMPKFASDFAHN